MVKIKVGTVVFSKAGHDKGQMFLTLSVENGFAFIADGKLRKAEKPKKKKFIHLQGTNYVNEIDPCNITNSEIRKILAQYKPV